MKLYKPNKSVFVLVKKDAEFIGDHPASMLWRYDIRPEGPPEQTYDFVSKILPYKGGAIHAWDRCYDDEVVLIGAHVTNVNNVEAIHSPKLTKDVRMHMTDDSVWEANERILVPYVEVDRRWGSPAIASGKILSKGTQLLIKRAKTEIGPLGNERFIKVEIDDEEYLIPACFLGQMTCITKGKEKTYWRLLDKHDKPVRSKRYQALSSVKGAVHVITGIMNEDKISELGWSNAYGLREKFDDWVAVEYDYKTNAELKRKDLSEWFTMHKLEHYER